MSAPPNSRGAPITDPRALAEYLAVGSKSPDQFRIGTEHEKFVYRRADGLPATYEGAQGIRALMETFVRFGWQPVFEGDRLLALTRNQESITLEPAGQFELSGAPVETLHETAAEFIRHMKEAVETGDELGLGYLLTGFTPFWRLDQMPHMPKARSEIMRRYMPKVGTLGLDMMHRTCTVQVNLDFASEADMVAKMRVSMALQPLATAMFANSPFVEGKPSLYQSYRSHVWTDTDRARSGILGFVFEPGFGFERYVSYMLDVPMYFVYRDGQYLDAAGQSFRDFLAGKLPALPGEIPHMGDWSDHLTTAFPEVRLKRFIEMRGADVSTPDLLLALPAFWVGLLYDPVALDQAAQLVRGWTADAVIKLRAEVPQLGLAARIGGRSLRDIGRDAVAIAVSGLRARARLNDAGQDESYLLAALEELSQTGQTVAEQRLARYDGEWNRALNLATFS